MVFFKEIVMESFEKLQSRFPDVSVWEETKLTRKGHRVLTGKIETSDEHFIPDAFGDDGNWETRYSITTITVVVDVKTNQVYTHNVEEW